MIRISSPVILKAVDGRPTECTYKIATVVRVANMGTGVSLFLNAYVHPHLKSGILLGMDFLVRSKVIINMIDNTISFLSKAPFSFSSSPITLKTFQPSDHESVPDNFLATRTSYDAFSVSCIL